MQFYKRVLMNSSILFLVVFNTVLAGNVEILAAEFHNTGGTYWSVNVTLKHEDTGWKHYADNWQIVDSEGKILADRVLFHPHVYEQPFTRSLENIHIPMSTKIVYIKAHDKVHGWTENRIIVDLDKVKDNYLRVENK